MNQTTDQKAKTRSKRRVWHALALSFIALAAPAGCSRGKGALVVYTYDAFPQQLSSMITDHLSTSYGTTVEFERFADTGGVYNQLIAELDDPRADVVIGLDTTYLPMIRTARALEPYRPDAVRYVESALVVDREFLAVAFDYGGVTLNYDSEALPEPPLTWEELLDPAFEKSIILMNPATSSPGRNFLLFTVFEFGPDRFLDFWKRLKPNILTVAGTWFEGYGLYIEGEAPIVLSYETSPAYHIEYEGTDRYKQIFLDGRAYAQIEIAGIVRGAAHRKAAERLIDYLLSEEFQTQIPLNQFMFPVRTGITVPEAFEAARSRRTLVRVPEADISGNLRSWIEEWESVMQ